MSDTIVIQTESTEVEVAVDPHTVFVQIETEPRESTLNIHAGVPGPPGSLAPHTHPVSDVTGLQSALGSLAPLASPSLTGTPNAPTAAPGTATTQIATTEFVSAAVVQTQEYTHTQSTPAALWTVNHNLNRYPGVTVIDSTNREVFGGRVVYLSANTLTISFGGAFSGKASCN
jgi:hypothetical protein